MGRSQPGLQHLVLAMRYGQPRRVHAATPDAGQSQGNGRYSMRTRATRRQGELNRRRLRSWQAAAACAVTLASLVISGAGMPQPPAQASTQTATASAPVPVVGVQDGWINGPVASGVAAKVTRSPAALGIHDGAINRCDGSGKLQKHPVRINVAGADASFGSPLWGALNVTTVRYSPPWDVAEPTADPSPQVQQLLQVNEECLAAWLIDAAKATPAITSVEIAFRPDGYYLKTARGNIKRGGHSKLQAAIPSLRTYQGAVQQFLDAFTCGTATCPDKVAVPGLANQGLGMAMAPVRIIAPWGEPDYGRGVYEMPSGARGDTFDNPACPNKATVANCGPELAAGMYNYVRQHCTACAQVIAGDFGSGASAHPGQTFSRGQSSATTCACTTGTCAMPRTSPSGGCIRTATWNTRRSCGGTVGTARAARRSRPGPAPGSTPSPRR